MATFAAKALLACQPGVGGSPSVNNNSKPLQDFALTSLLL